MCMHTRARAHMRTCAREVREDSGRALRRCVRPSAPTVAHEPHQAIDGAGGGDRLPILRAPVCEDGGGAAVWPSSAGLPCAYVCAYVCAGLCICMCMAPARMASAAVAFI